MTMTETPEIEWVEETPVRIRRGPASRPWDDLLLPKLRANPNKTFRLFTFQKRQSAVNRNQHIRNRLREVAPTADVRCEVAEYAPGAYGSYITYLGEKADV